MSGKKIFKGEAQTSNMCYLKSVQKSILHLARSLRCAKFSSPWLARCPSSDPPNLVRAPPGSSPLPTWPPFVSAPTAVQLGPHRFNSASRAFVSASGSRIGRGCGRAASDGELVEGERLLRDINTKKSSNSYPNNYPNYLNI